MAVKTNTELFRDRLIVKCMGKKEWIEHFCTYINRLYSPDRINFSPIYKDKYKPQFFCFINILYDRPNPSNDKAEGEG